MNWFFNKKYRLGFGFGVIIFIVAGTLVMTMMTLQRSYDINRKINDKYVPSIGRLQDLESYTLRSKDLIKEWAFVQRVEEDLHRKEMKSISDSSLVKSWMRLKEVKSNFNAEEQLSIDSLEKKVGEMLVQFKAVQELLPTFDSYSNPIALMDAESYFIEGSGIPLVVEETEGILNRLRKKQTERMNAEIEEMNVQFSRLTGVLVVVSLFVLFAGIAIAYFTTKLRKQKEESEVQKEQLNLLYRDLTDSINYAQRLQNTILPNIGAVRQIFNKSFVFYVPKAVVSGDFYWFKNVGGKKLFAAADCTGHGVPGAFMSLVGHNFLNHVTKVFLDPAQILNNINRLGTEVLRNNNTGVRDGMDIALCAIDEKELTLEYCGANIPLYVVRNNELMELAPTKRSIGTFGERGETFETQKFQLEKNDMVYACSDGYADQFGEANNKKFMRKRFKEILTSISIQEIDAQEKTLHETFNAWKGSMEQTDDLLVIGIRI
ncbi:MAG: SpoIIE family protein phosphatase [Flavobacteriales bacterium]|jgi:serine phosphatase RsbU (regulator of sigma subunit)|nr:SpoIIE family protein phosphatase [Flavobacteriales bacterium]MDP4717040.1 SpoIIE family protein phosphatase [Flavobacteriales bacterium]MDP4730684.1 SpoIIE family protein phosphatase [Flavobacteriales bacterium]MDP4819206.1 SpoIIE family protein phosphatase [Flavobacteriales bacterium]MDP4950467.1 SpoIIE family protein phosphatase [Flavobacteriales bacterium]